MAVTRKELPVTLNLPPLSGRIEKPSEVVLLEPKARRMKRIGHAQLPHGSRQRHNCTNRERPIQGCLPDNLWTRHSLPLAVA